MPRTISIDNVQVMQVQFSKDEKGEVHVSAHYNLRSGGQVIQPLYQDLTPRLSAARKAAAAALFDGIAQDAGAIESV